MANNNKKEFKSMVTPVFRVSFPAVFSAQLPKGETDEKKAKFGVTMLFDMTDPKVAKGVEEMKAFAIECGKEKWGQDLSKWPKIEHPLFRKGDEKKEADGTYKPGFGPNIIFSKASLRLYKKDGVKRMPPQIVDVQGKTIIEPNEFYGGCYARAKIAAGTYEYMGKHGVSFYLMSLRKEKDGERFASTHDAADDFEGIEAPEGSAVPPAAAGGSNPNPFL